MSEENTASQKHILIVEDNQDDSLVLSHILEKMMCHKVTVACSGTEALHLAEQIHFDMVILDMRLPDLQGTAVAEALRQMEGYRQIPMGMLTAYDVSGMRDLITELGCDFYLAKPFQVDTLVRLLSKSLS